jgi:dihydrofolate reductase
MRKVIVSMNVTLDGFMSGPNCELDWHFQSWTAEMAEVACEQLGKADTILFGRVTYSAMARYWTSKTTNLTLAREDIDFADMLTYYNKVVFSKTLTALPWTNSRLVKENMADEIVRLKQQPGKDIIIYGSGSLVSTLVQSGLVDEYQIWVHPVLLGKGKPLFKGLHDRLHMKLFKTQKFRSGVVMLSYAYSRYISF